MFDSNECPHQYGCTNVCVYAVYYNLQTIILHNIGTNTQICIHTQTHTNNTHTDVRPEQVCSTDEVGRFHLDLATIPVAMGRQKTVPTSVTMVTGRQRILGLFILWSYHLLSEPGTTYYIHTYHYIQMSPSNRTTNSFIC